MGMRLAAYEVASHVVPRANLLLTAVILGSEAVHAGYRPHNLLFAAPPSRTHSRRGMQVSPQHASRDEPRVKPLLASVAPSLPPLATDSSSLQRTLMPLTAALDRLTEPFRRRSDDMQQRSLSSSLGAGPDVITETAAAIQSLQEHRRAVSELLVGAGAKEGAGGPEHLVVLAHGLAGTSEDLSYLGRVLKAAPAGSSCHVLAARCNAQRTMDGVEAGGARLAKEIANEIARNPSLKRISFVGNSLGGLYVRYAAAVLHSSDSGKFAGLDGECLVTTATPHLGIKSFTYVPIPEQLHALAGVFVGRTGDDLYMQEKRPQGEQPLLELMATHVSFLSALRSFRRRRAYANLEGDFLVPFGTAAFEVVGDEAGWGLLEKRVADRFVSRAREMESVCGKVACELRTAPAAQVQVASAGREARMAAHLDACGWSKVGVHFGGPLPLSHNKIIALEGGGILRAPFLPLWKEGRGVVSHVGDYLLGGD